MSVRGSGSSFSQSAREESARNPAVKGFFVHMEGPLALAACSTRPVPVPLRRLPPAAAELLRSHRKIETMGLLLFEQNPVTLTMRDFA